MRTFVTYKKKYLCLCDKIKPAASKRKGRRKKFSIKCFCFHFSLDSLLKAKAKSSNSRSYENNLQWWNVCRRECNEERKEGRCRIKKGEKTVFIDERKRSVAYFYFIIFFSAFTMNELSSFASEKYQGCK